jgi:hypothetical protein
MSSIDKLTQVLAKPKKPYFPISDPDKWNEVESRIGTQLPNDFKDFIGHYGTGAIGDFIVLFNPFSPIKSANYFDYMDFVLRTQREFNESPFPVFPEHEGMLPLATTSDGDRILWLTKGSPDTWTIVVLAVRSDYYETYPFGMSELLFRLTTPESDPKSDITLNSRIFDSFIRKAQFESTWVQIRRSFYVIRKYLIEETTRNGNKNISKAVFQKLLSRQGFELDDDLVQEKLKKWKRSSFIELVREADVYLRVK